MTPRMKQSADVNFFLARIFMNYNYPSGWYLTSGPIITGNWEASSGETWDRKYST